MSENRAKSRSHCIFLRDLDAVDMLVNEPLDERQRPRSMKPSFFHTSAKQDHRGKTAHTIVTGQFHVFAFIDLDLGQHKPAFVVFDQFFQHRRDHQTGRAPFRPQVHQHRLQPRRLDDLFIEIMQVDIEYGFSFMRKLHVENLI